MGDVEKQGVEGNGTRPWKANRQISPLKVANLLVVSIGTATFGGSKPGNGGTPDRSQPCLHLWQLLDVKRPLSLFKVGTQPSECVLCEIQLGARSWFPFFGTYSKG